MGGGRGISHERDNGSSAKKTNKFPERQVSEVIFVRKVRNEGPPRLLKKKDARGMDGKGEKKKIPKKQKGKSSRIILENE